MLHIAKGVPETLYPCLEPCAINPVPYILNSSSACARSLQAALPQWLLDEVLKKKKAQESEAAAAAAGGGKEGGGKEGSGYREWTAAAAAASAAGSRAGRESDEEDEEDEVSALISTGLKYSWRGEMDADVQAC